MHAPVYHFWMRIFSGRVPAAGGHQQQCAGMWTRHHCKAEHGNSTSTRTTTQGLGIEQSSSRNSGATAGQVGRAPVCAATIFFRSPMVSSSLHFTRICTTVVGARPALQS